MMWTKVKNHTFALRGFTVWTAQSLDTVWIKINFNWEKKGETERRDSLFGFWWVSQDIQFKHIWYNNQRGSVCIKHHTHCAACFCFLRLTIECIKKTSPLLENFPKQTDLQSAPFKRGVNEWTSGNTPKNISDPTESVQLVILSCTDWGHQTNSTKVAPPPFHI